MNGLNIVQQELDNAELEVLRSFVREIDFGVQCIKIIDEAVIMYNLLSEYFCAKILMLFNDPHYTYYREALWQSW